MSVSVPVPADYRHAAKLARPGAPLTLAGAELKWYEVAPPATPAPEEIRTLARDHLARTAERDELAIEGEVGFCILHRCGRGFYFLILCTWRNQNEVWETVWAKDGDADPAFRPWPAAGPHRPAFCVWELGVVCHESRAWSRFLRSDRGPGARAAYLADGFDGSV
jgi:hypothetical protein